MPTVIIHVSGGVVQDVECPVGITYEVRDYDNCECCSDDPDANEFDRCPDYCADTDQY